MPEENVSVTGGGPIGYTSQGSDGTVQDCRKVR